MIDVTLRQISKGMANLQQLVPCRVPIKAAYAISKLINACNAEITEFSKVRDGLYREGGCTIADSRWIHEDPAILAKLQADVEEMLDSTAVQLNALHLDIAQFGNCELPAGAFIDLEWALKPETEGA